MKSNRHEPEPTGSRAAQARIVPNSNRFKIDNPLMFAGH
jgi:hypothetical protein